MSSLRISRQVPHLVTASRHVEQAQRANRFTRQALKVEDKFVRLGGFTQMPAPLFGARPSALAQGLTAGNRLIGAAAVGLGDRAGRFIAGEGEDRQARGAQYGRAVAVGLITIPSTLVFTGLQIGLLGLRAAALLGNTSIFRGGLIHGIANTALRADTMGAGSLWAESKHQTWSQNLAQRDDAFFQRLAGDAALLTPSPLRASSEQPPPYSEVFPDSGEFGPLPLPPQNSID